MENHLVEELAPLFGGFPFQADEEGYYTLRVPRWGGNEHINFIAVGDDYGDLVHGVFLNPEKHNGQLVQGMSESATATQLVEAFEKGKFLTVNKTHRWTMLTYHSNGQEEPLRPHGRLEVF